MKRNLTISGFFCLLSLSVAAQSLSPSELKAKLAPGTSITVTDKLLLEGVTVSDCNSKNMALNPNIDHSKVDITLSDRTAYIQSADGSCGVRVVFNEVPAASGLKRYESVQLDLQGCTVVRNSDPDFVSISNITADKVISRKEGGPDSVSPKSKTVAQLTDDDIFTFVSLQNLDFIVKDCSYANIYEGYSQLSPIHTGTYVKGVNNRMDGWATLLRDSDGRTIYMAVNTLCLWRKTGKEIPAGIGTMSGIIDHCPMRRYGGDMGRYTIRPVDVQDIQLARKRNSPWKTLTGWILDGANGQCLEFDYLGLQTGVWKDGKKGDKVVNDAGSTKGLLWTDSDSFIHIENSLKSFDGRDNGYKSNGAVMFRGPLTGWFEFDGTGKAVSRKAFYVSFNARKVKGTMLQFNFEWCAGSQNINECYGFPAIWQVECSIEGGQWQTLTETATGAKTVVLRSLPYWDGKYEPLEKSCKTSYDCGLGYQQRSFALPVEAIGHNVTIRIIPVGDSYCAPHSHPTTPVAGGNHVTPDLKKLNSIIKFSTISIDYK